MKVNLFLNSYLVKLKERNSRLVPSPFSGEKGGGRGGILLFQEMKSLQTNAL